MSASRGNVMRVAAEARRTVRPTRVVVGFVAALAAAWIASVAARAADAPERKVFASPEQAFSALVDAARAGDEATLLSLLGEVAKPILESGDPVADRAALERFVASYDEKHAIEQTGDDRAVLVTGPDAWPMPIPAVKEPEGWTLDTEAGFDEIIARRVGRNERFAIQACLAFVDAQREYWERNPDGAPLLHYASKLLSSEGKRDGLYYPTEEGEAPSPLGLGFARAKAAGYEKSDTGPTPFHGYYYRILDAQGPHAHDGAYGYLANGYMIGGFALLAYPATWDNSGVMTFLVNQDGVVYQKDLGPETAKLAQAIERFDPDDSWTRVSDDDTASDADAATAD